MTGPWELWLEHPEWLVAVGLATAGVLGALVLANAIARPRLCALVGRDAARPLWRRRALRDGLLAVALVALGVGLLGPRIGERTVHPSTTGVDLVVLLDASRSMDAVDPAPSRLARARRAAKQILERLGPGDRAALAAYAGRGVLLTPLTPDHRALAELVDAVDSRLVRPGGSNLRAGVEAALEAFDPADARSRAVLVLGDGETMPASTDSGAVAAQRAGTRVLAVAFGSDVGAQVPDRGAPLLDRRGQPVVSRRDSEPFRALAEATAGAVFLADAWGEVDLDAVASALRSHVSGPGRSRDPRPGTDGAPMQEVTAAVVGPFAAVGFGLLLLELAWPWGAPVRRGRPARAGALLFALLALGGGRPDGPPTPAQLLAVGHDYAEQGDWAAARRVFLAAAVTATDPGLAGLAQHNAGYAALQEGALEAARDAFFDSLALRPRNRRTQFDLEWTLRRLEAQWPPPPPDAAPRSEPDAAPKPPEAPEPSPDVDLRALHTAGQAEGGEASSDGARAGRVHLGAEERARWLERVEDDSGAALRAAAGEGARFAGRPRGAPTW